MQSPIQNERKLFSRYLHITGVWVRTAEVEREVIHKSHHRCGVCGGDVICIYCCQLMTPNTL